MFLLLRSSWFAPVQGVLKIRQIISAHCLYGDQKVGRISRLKQKMDLLGSILNSMDKPPSCSDKQKLLRKKQKEELLKQQKAEQEALKKFREKIEEKINKFIQDGSATRYEFQPMEKVYRSIVHDVAEVAGIGAFSIGEEEIDRRIFIYKKEFAPCEEELAALRRGEKWDPEKAKLLAKQKELEEKEEEEERLKRKKEKFEPVTNYKDKYSHLIGTAAAKDAAQKTQFNKQYGFVPSENKRDQRSIEETLADIQSKKKMKLAQQTS